VNQQTIRSSRTNKPELNPPPPFLLSIAEENSNPVIQISSENKTEQGVQLNDSLSQFYPLGKTKRSLWRSKRMLEQSIAQNKHHVLVPS